MKLGQKGFSVVEGLLILIVVSIVGFGGWYVWNQNQEDEPVASISSYEECVAAGHPVMESYPEQCAVPGGETFTRKLTPAEQQNIDKDAESTIPEGWVEYINSELGFTSEYPDVLTLIHSGLPQEKDAQNAKYGEVIFFNSGPDESVALKFEVVWNFNINDAIYARSDGQNLSNAYEEGGVKSVAALSWQINKDDDNPNFNKTIGDLQEISVGDFEGWGFTTTGSLSTDFINGEDGFVVDSKTMFIFIEVEHAILRLQVPTESTTGQQMLDTFRIL